MVPASPTPFTPSGLTGEGIDILTATERFTKPPARFSEAALVKKLEELGIGRPSTYAPTISKIMEENRGYVVKLNREGEQRQFRILRLEEDVISKKMGSETERARPALASISNRRLTSPLTTPLRPGSK